VTREVDFHGIQMMPGDRIAMSTSLTSRDPEAWERPNEIRFDRQPSHLALGSSTHRCLGMHLARRELLIAEQEILANLPEFFLDGAEKVPFLLGNIIQVQELQLRW
jgi:cytochrome P450